MIKHIILWNLKDEYSNEEKAEIVKNIKSGLEALIDKVPGIVEIKVQTEHLETSTVDLMLDSTFENADALKNYATHPEHVKVADTLVRPYTAHRSCIDFEI